jgi:hypothetical protein
MLAVQLCQELSAHIDHAVLRGRIVAVRNRIDQLVRVPSRWSSFEEVARRAATDADAEDLVDTVFRAARVRIADELYHHHSQESGKAFEEALWPYLVVLVDNATRQYKAEHLLDPGIAPSPAEKSAYLRELQIHERQIIGSPNLSGQTPGVRRLLDTWQEELLGRMHRLAFYHSAYHPDQPVHYEYAHFAATALSACQGTADVWRRACTAQAEDFALAQNLAVLPSIVAHGLVLDRTSRRLCLGSGTSARVYAARQRGNEIALRAVRLPTDSALLARLATERRNMWHLSTLACQPFARSESGWQHLCLARDQLATSQYFMQVFSRLDYVRRKLSSASVADVNRAWETSSTPSCVRRCPLPLQGLY